MRPYALLLLAGLAAVVPFSPSSQAAPVDKQFGLDERVPWTTSRLESSPDPPPAYRLTHAFPQAFVQMPVLEDMAGRYPGVKIVVDHLGKPDLKFDDPWPEFKKSLKKFPQVWVSASEPYELSITKEHPYRDTIPFFKATYEEFGGKQLIWGTGYPRPRWELPMDKELKFVDKYLDFYTAEDRELLLGKNAIHIWRFPKQ